MRALIFFFLFCPKIQYTYLFCTMWCLHLCHMTNPLKTPSIWVLHVFILNSIKTLTHYQFVFLSFSSHSLWCQINTLKKIFTVNISFSSSYNHTTPLQHPYPFSKILPSLLHCPITCLILFSIFHCRNEIEIKN